MRRLLAAAAVLATSALSGRAGSSQAAAPASVALRHDLPLVAGGA